MRLQVFDRPQHEQIVDRLQVWFLLRLPLKALDLLTLLPLDLLQRGDQIPRRHAPCQIHKIERQHKGRIGQHIDKKNEQQILPRPNA